MIKPFCLFSGHLNALESRFHPKRLVKFDAIIPISAKKQQATEDLKVRLREILDFYADLALEAEGKTQQALNVIENQLTERSHKQLV